MLVEQSYVTDRGRTRRRKVNVDLEAVRRGLALPTTDDRGDWERIRGLLGETVGESRFAIWLAPLELVASTAVFPGMPVSARSVHGEIANAAAGIGSPSSARGPRRQPVKPQSGEPFLRAACLAGEVIPVSYHCRLIGLRLCRRP